MAGPLKFTQAELLNITEFRRAVVRGRNIALYVKYQSIYKREDVDGYIIN